MLADEQDIVAPRELPGLRRTMETPRMAKGRCEGDLDLLSARRIISGMAGGERAGAELGERPADHILMTAVPAGECCAGAGNHLDFGEGDDQKFDIGGFERIRQV